MYPKGSTLEVENSLNEHQSKLNGQLSEKVEKLEKWMKTEIENCRHQLMNKIEENQNSTKADIDNRYDDLTKIIDQNQNKFKTNMAELAVKTEHLQKANSSLGSKISHVNEILLKKIVQTEKAIKSDFDNREKKFQSQIIQINETVTKGNAALKDSVSKSEKALKNSHVQKCEELSKKIDKNAKSMQVDLGNRCKQLRNTINTNHENIESELKLMNVTKVTLIH